MFARGGPAAPPRGRLGHDHASPRRTLSRPAQASPRASAARHPLARRQRAAVRCAAYPPGDGDAATAAASPAEPAPQPLPASQPPAARVGHVFHVLWERLIKPLRDFGFGRRNIWEGGVGLFVLGGFVMLGLVVGWVRGLNFSRTRSYQAILEFPLACGITVGTPVRVRGVSVGSVLSVRPSLERVDVLVEVDDVAVKIPRSSLVEANQSGLIAETLIDITPRSGLPPGAAGPLDPACASEGLVVCDRSRLQGRTGVSLDALVAVCTRLALEVETLGLGHMWAAGQDMQTLASSLAPLVKQAGEIAAEVRPLLAQVRDGELLASVERLAEAAAATAADVRTLNAAILTPENTELLRASVGTLTRLLAHVEAVSGDVAALTGDSPTRASLRTLIQSLSRLVDN